MATRQVKPCTFSSTTAELGAGQNYYCAAIDEDDLEAYDDAIVYSAPYLINNQCEVALSNLFYVKLKTDADKELLYDFAETNNASVISEEFLPSWYTLACTKFSTGNALELAVKAYESGLFAASDVELLGDVQIDDSIYNDPRFVSQWNLTGTYGIDIEETHAITMGNANVIVAVLDNGIQLDHPDLVIENSWDASSQTSPGRLYYDSVTGEAKYHGTAMASIIGATPNNGLGIVGVAPDVSLLPISVNFENQTSESLARAIKYAADNGAHIISNSWSSGGAHDPRDEAFQYALSNGCIVVQSSGNQSSTVPRYPYCLYPDVIVVGNSNVNGFRNSTSNYSSHLDIVAPGTDIWMLDASSGDLSASGTSPACAHISAIAALMLSVNPELTRQEVTDIIEKTARKLPAYTFSETSDRTNGTWNNEVGYGLVNCLDAVTMAHYYKEDSYSDLVGFDYSGTNVTVTLTTQEDIAIIWDWDTKDISYIHADPSSVVDTTLTHTYASSSTRHIRIAEPVAIGDVPATSSSALVEFELPTGNYASNIDIKSSNIALKYINIIGGSGFVSQTVSIKGLPALEKLYLVQCSNSSISVSDCPVLKRFGTSRGIWRYNTGVVTTSLPDDNELSPTVVGGGGTAKKWPNVPESVVAPQTLKITNCPAINTLSLENVGFVSYNFSGLPNLSYVYLSSQASKIVGAGSNALMPATYGYFLSAAVATLPSRSASSAGTIVIRAVNTTNTSFIPVKIAANYRTSIENKCSNKGWNLVWNSV